MLKRRSVVAVKIEGTYGVDAVPGNGDAILVEEATAPSSEGLRMVERNPIRDNISPLSPIYAGRLGVVTFSCELKGSGSAGTAPEIDALFRCCGMGVTISAGVSVTYNPASVTQESATLYYYLDGTRYILTGCRGTYTLNLETGNKAMAEFTITGHVTDPTDTAIASPTFDSTVPAPLINVPFTIAGYSAVINAMTIDMGGTIATNPDMSAVDGYGEVRFTAFNQSGSIDPENTLLATNDWYADFTSNTPVILSLGPIGSSVGNRIEVDCPKVIYTDISHADRDDTATLDLPFIPVDDAGDDFIGIKFT